MFLQLVCVHVWDVRIAFIALDDCVVVQAAELGHLRLHFMLSYCVLCAQFNSNNNNQQYCYILLSL